MTVKIKSVAADSKSETAKCEILERNVLLNDCEICFFRRKKDVVESLLNSGQENEYEIFFIGNKRFYRKKTNFENKEDMSDTQLLEMAQKENREIYSDLFKRYQRKLFVYIYRLTGDRSETEDILQNVFIKTYKNIHKFDLSRQFSAWIYRIAHNEAVNHLKRKSKRHLVSWEDIATSKDKLSTASGEESMEEHWLHEEITKEIDEALKKMPQQYRRILYMRYFKDYSYLQISHVLDKPVNTVGTIINRAKKKLFELVREEVARNKGK